MRKLNGYRPSHRNRWMFIEQGILSSQELCYLEYCVDIMDFDPDHDSYGKFKIDFENSIKTFRKSENSVRNWHNKLLRIGLIRKTDKKGEYQPACFTRYISPGPRWKGDAMIYAKQEMNQTFEAILQNIGIKLQNIGEKAQPVGEVNDDFASKSDVKALSSSKVESNVIPIKKVVIKQEVRSEEEYQKMYQNDPDGLTPDDMRWVDENVKEVLEISKENEQSVVDLYFDGNWDKYKNNLIL